MKIISSLSLIFLIHSISSSNDKSQDYDIVKEVAKDYLKFFSELGTMKEGDPRNPNNNIMKITIKFYNFIDTSKKGKIKNDKLASKEYEYATTYFGDKEYMLGYISDNIKKQNYSACKKEVKVQKSFNKFEKGSYTSVTIKGFCKDNFTFDCEINILSRDLLVIKKN